MTILNMLINRLEKSQASKGFNTKVTVRKITSGKNKGDTGLYLNKTRVLCTSDRKELISRLNFLS